MAHPASSSAARGIQNSRMTVSSSSDQTKGAVANIPLIACTRAAGRPRLTRLLGLLAEDDDAGRGEAIDLLAREPELAEHLGGVLAEQRRGAIDARRRAGGAAGEREHLHLAHPGLIDLGHESQVTHLRVLEDLVEFVDGPRRYAARLQSRHPT